MIIACPTCSTGFNLPEDRITLKGVKLRCSKCGHVFRVRKGTSDEPEIFYKPGEEPAPEPAKDSNAHLSTQIGFGFDTSNDPDPKTIDLEPHLHGVVAAKKSSVSLQNDYFSDDFGLDDLSLAQEDPAPEPMPTSWCRERHPNQWRRS